MEQSRKDKHRSNNADRDVPGDNLLPQHISQTNEQCQCTNLTHSPSTVRMTAKEKTQRVRQLIQHRRITVLHGLLHNGQRCGSRLCIKIAVPLPHLRPCRHLGGEGHKQGTTAYQGGIEEIIAETTKRHLGHTDSEERTDEDDPDGEVRRQVESKEQTRQGSRSVKDGQALPFQDIFADGPLEEDAGCHTRYRHDDGAQSEEIERHEQGGQQGDDDTIHITLYRIGAVGVWRK